MPICGPGREAVESFWREVPRNGNAKLCNTSRMTKRVDDRQHHPHRRRRALGLEATKSAEQIC